MKKGDEIVCVNGVWENLKNGPIQNHTYLIEGFEAGRGKNKGLIYILLQGFNTNSFIETAFKMPRKIKMKNDVTKFLANKPLTKEVVEQVKNVKNGIKN